jgi:hypothetical protein
MDIRSYCNPHPPRFSKDAQLALLTGEIYIEDWRGKVIDALLLSLRKGAVVEVVETFLLAPVKGHTRTRRRLLTDRIEAIKAKGASIQEVATGDQSGGGKLPRMLLRAYEMIATSGRAAAKRENPGRPRIEYTNHGMTIMEGIWHSRRHHNDDERLTKIKAMTGKKPSRAWLWNRFGSPKRGKAE